MGKTLLQPTPDHSEFLALVEKLELASGRPLREPLRGKFWVAYRESPAGFRRAAERAIDDADRNPIGLLAWRIARGEHLLGPKPKPPVRGAGACVVCERLVPDAVRLCGVWWCREHVKDAA